jgi:hypothetical protein
MLRVPMMSMMVSPLRVGYTRGSLIFVIPQRRERNNNNNTQHSTTLYAPTQRLSVRVVVNSRKSARYTGVKGGVGAVECGGGG